MTTPLDARRLFESIKPYCKRHELPKGTQIFGAGHICQHLYYVESGIMRAYYQQNGKEITCHFAKQGELNTAIDSFFSRKPSIYSTDVLEDAVIYSISHSQLENTYDLIPEMNRYGRIYITQLYVEFVDRYNSALFDDAELRYQKFCEQYPDLIMRVPLGHIATFLGMSQETLSRIRGKFARGQ